MITDLYTGDCLDIMAFMPDKHVDLTIGSPPYAGKGQRYGTKAKWPPEPWIEWMHNVTKQAVRVSSNVVVWIVNGFVKDGHYQPVVEALISDCWRGGLRCERPVIWHKNAPPNRRDWFGNDWEFCIAFRPENSIGYFDHEAIGTPPKFSAGGRFRQRTANGKRRLGNEYPKGKLTRPRDVLRVTVGGGHLGSDLAHLNEAPFPEKIVEPFILTCCRAGKTALDPFVGSGTVPAVAARYGRGYIGIDNRQDQIDLSKRRIAENNGQSPKRRGMIKT